MPNTLAHLGVQGVLTRSWLSRADPKWICLGCIIPDIPWIGQRAALVTMPWIDPYSLRLYAIAQASLLCSLLLCGALAALSRTPRLVFAVLASNALLHLLLDACQTKWANGVHILAPFSWYTWNLGWFWPESPVTYLLTAFGLGYALWAVRISYRWSPPFWRFSARRLGITLALMGAYLVAPAMLRHGPEAADAHFVRTFRERDARGGRPVELDRAWIQRVGPGAHIIGVSGEEILVVGQLPERSTRASVRGRFVDPRTLAVDEIHEHRGWRRDLASYAGLALVAIVWAVAVLRSRWDTDDSGSHP